ncbi:MAG: DUF4139 domain-containing protein, partial [Spirulina sp.]
MQLASQIDKAKIYAAGATVTRVAQLQLGEGQVPDRVEIPDLPLALEDGSVTAKIESNLPEPAIATDIKVGVALPSSRQDWQEPPLETEMRAAREEVEGLEDAIAIVENEIGILNGLQIPDRPQGEKGKAPPLSPIAPRLELANYQSEQLALRVQEKQGIAERLRLAKEHFRDLEQRQRRASTAKQARPDELRKTVTIGLNYEGDTSRFAEQQLILEYFIPGARWTPAYVFRIDSRQNRALVAVRALICQRTGEDWTGVRLELSTAEPATWCELPELASLRIGRAQPSPKKQGWRSPPVGVELLFADYDRDRRQPQYSDSPQLRLPSLSPLPSLSRRYEEIDEFEDVLYSMMELESEEEYGTFSELESADMAAGGFGAASEMSLPLSSEKSIGRIPAPPKARKKAARQARINALTANEGRWETAKVNDKIPGGIQGEIEIESFANLLSYGSLRLRDASDRNQRGKLFLAQTSELYLEVLQRQHIKVDFNLLGIVQQEVRRAQQCLNLPLPQGGSNVRQAAGSFDYAYRADGIADIPSDGQFHSVALTQQDAEMEIRYVVVPREDENAFRVAILCNPLIAPLLPGLADIYLNDEYLFSRPIATVPPKGKLELGLGVEQGIKTARNTTYQETRSGFAMVGANKFEHRIEIE